MKQSKLHCSECGSTDVWQMSWVRANRISWMLDYNEDVRGYSETWPQPQAKCMECGEKVNLIEKESEHE